MNKQTAKQLVNCLDEIFHALRNIQSDGAPQECQLADLSRSINELEVLLAAEPQP